MVLLYIDELTCIGGAEKLLVTQYNFLKKSGKEVKLITFNVNKDYFDIDHIIISNYNEIINIIKDTNPTYFYIHSDWDIKIMKLLNEISKYTKVELFTHTSLLGNLGAQFTEQDDLVKLLVYNMDNHYINRLYVFRDFDLFLCEKLGWKSVKYISGVTYKKQDIKPSNKLVAIASNWNTNGKNVQDVVEMEKLTDIKVYGRNYEGAIVDTIDNILQPGTVVFMPFVKENRSLTIMEAYVRNIPVICYEASPNLSNCYIVNDVNEAYYKFLELKGTLQPEYPYLPEIDESVGFNLSLSYNIKDINFSDEIRRVIELYLMRYNSLNNSLYKLGYKNQLIDVERLLDFGVNKHIAQFYNGYSLGKYNKIEDCKYIVLSSNGVYHIEDLVGHNLKNITTITTKNTVYTIIQSDLYKYYKDGQLMLDYFSSATYSKE